MRIHPPVHDRVAELFTSDAVLETPDLELRGAKSIDAWYRSQFCVGGVKTLHCWSNLVVEPQGGARFRAESNAIVAVRSPNGGEPQLRLGFAIDDVLIEEGAARFVRRRLRVAFAQAPAGPDK